MSREHQPTYLYLIRHGQAIVNVEPIIGGMKGDRGLTALGRQQAERLRDRLKLTGEIAADILLASTLPRARETAEIISPAFSCPLLLDDDLQEFRSGDAGDGMTVEEYTRQFGWVDFETEPFAQGGGGGESFALFTLRVASTLDRIVRAYAGKTIVAVCHGGVIDTSFLYFYGMSGFVLPRALFDTRNTSITCWKNILRHGKPNWILDRYNDDAHLRGQISETGIAFLTDAPEQPAVPTEG